MQTMQTKKGTKFAKFTVCVSNEMCSQYWDKRKGKETQPQPIGQCQGFKEGKVGKALRCTAAYAGPGGLASPAAFAALTATTSGRKCHI